MKKAMKYFLRFFSNEANLVVVTSPTKVEGVVSGFKKDGKDVKEIEV